MLPMVIFGANESQKPSTATGNAQNLCRNGGFELLMEAAASPLPQEWSPLGTGASRVVDISSDAAEGKRSLHLLARGADTVGVNGSVMAVEHGLVRLRYKVIQSSVGGKNLALFAIALNGPAGSEITRQGFFPPKEHVGDGQWHEGSFEFDFTPQQSSYCLLAPRINENASSTGDGEWLLDDIQVVRIHAKANVAAAYLWSEKPVARTGDTIRFSAFVENTGGEEAQEVAVKLSASSVAITLHDPVRKIAHLTAGSYERVDWNLTASQPGTVQIEVAAEMEGGKREPKSYQELVVDKNIAYSRQELCTDPDGYWRLLDKPSALQENNSAPVAAIKHKKSSEIKHNPYGLCVHLPRAKDYEDPYNPAHLIDGNADTCWSSQQRPSTYPGNPPRVEIDLGRTVTLTQVNLVPYWHNTDFPLGFTVRVSEDGRKWTTVLSVNRHRFNGNGPKRGDKVAQTFPLRKAQQARHVQIDFERLPLSGGNYAEVSQGYKARLSGIELLDEHGENLALQKRGASIRASEFFTGWQDTAATIANAFPKIMDIGVKWVRVGQWGDQTEWAAVEREKGKFSIDPVTEKAIDTLLDNHVDILWGLNYGNALYDRPEHPPDSGPMYFEGHPFYLNWGPRTEGGREAFVRYVDFVVRKYQKRIQWWELWNEENGWFPGHEPELYGKLLCAVSKHIKSINPKLKVMFGGTAAPAPLTTEIALREGAAPYVDACAFHPYGIDKPEGGMGTMESYQGKSLGQSREQTGWNRVEDIVAGVKKPFAQHGNTNVQVWLNEWSLNVSGLDYSYKPGIGEYGLAKYLTRFYIYNGWLGQPTAWWALHTENKSQDWGILEPESIRFRPLSFALQNVCSVASDVASIPALDYHYDGSAPDLKVIACQRDRSKEKAVFLWSAQMYTDKVLSYPGQFSFAVASKPRKVVLTDVYWGVSQPAVWSYENRRVIINGIIVHDYPVEISLE